MNRKNFRNVSITKRKRNSTGSITNYSSHGASMDKNSTRGWVVSGGSAIEDIERNIKTLRLRSRDLYMSGGIAGGSVRTVRTSVIGSGLRLSTKIDGDFLGMTTEEVKEWSRTVRREFDLWADSINCDATRVNNFYELQQLAFLSQMISGDAFVLLPYKKRIGSPYELTVHLIEADRVDTPPDKMLNQDNRIVSGVEVDRDGEVIAYHFSSEHPNNRSLLLNNKWTKVERFGRVTGRQNVLHLMSMERPEQRRGIPMLAPVIENLKQLSRYTDAELMAAVVNGMYSIFIESDTGEAPDSNFGGIDSEDRIYSDGDHDTDIEIGNGAVNFLRPGEKVAETKPGRPNPSFDGFVKSISRQIGTALEIPYEVLMKNFTASYSASRASLMEAWKMYKTKRDGIAVDFCQPVYEEWLAEAVAKGRIRAPGFFDDPAIRKAYSRAEWTGPSQGQIDPLKEAKASELMVENGFSTRERETTALTGMDYHSNHLIRITEEEDRREAKLDGGYHPVEKDGEEFEEDEN